jgi:hypothetical protein
MLRAPRQIDSQIKFFVAVGDGTVAIGNVFTPAELAAALTVKANNAIADGSIVNAQNATTFVTTGIASTATYSTGDNFRDMGETLYIQQAGVNYYIYRLAQPIDGAATEGVDTLAIDSGNVYILTWSSSGGVNVVRTGY